MKTLALITVLIGFNADTW